MAAEAQHATSSREHPSFAGAWLAAWQALGGRVSQSGAIRGVAYPFLRPCEPAKVLGIALVAPDHQYTAVRLLMALLDAAGPDARAAVFALASSMKG